MAKEDTRKLVKTTVRFVIVIVVLGILYEILPDLPGIHEIPFPGRLTTEEAGRSIIAFAALVVMLQYGRTLSTSITSLTKSLKVGRFFRDLIYLVAAAIGYKAFEEIAHMYLNDEWWIYALTFILIGVVLAIRIVRNLLGSVDKITDAIVGEEE